MPNIVLLKIAVKLPHNFSHRSQPRKIFPRQRETHASPLRFAQ
jgi:hypothetical protein